MVGVAVRELVVGTVDQVPRDAWPGLGLGSGLGLRLRLRVREPRAAVIEEDEYEGEQRGHRRKERHPPLAVEVAQVHQPRAAAGRLGDVGALGRVRVRVRVRVSG